MRRRPRVSVCMAAYNGARFIREQVESILPQLSAGDELVVVDDASRDETLGILEAFRDPRLRVIRQARNAGVCRTFENALREARGEVIFLSDQDDLWRADKVTRVLEVFDRDPDATLVLSNGELIDGQGQRLGETLQAGKSFSLGAVANLVRNRFQGSAMAFRREILAAVLPFPQRIPMHDSWIGIVNALVGKAVYLPQCLISYRRHEGNATSRSHGPIGLMIKQRWRLLRALAARSGELAGLRRSLRMPWTLRGRPQAG
jgi:glycosyltransferase involved in cell wall biosynthesis